MIPGVFWTTGGEGTRRDEVMYETSFLFFATGGDTLRTSCFVQLL